jgi:chemotaxis protein methyltransferase CheR
MIAEKTTLPLLDYELFRQLIREAFGLDYPLHKRDLLRARLERRLRANGLKRYSDYYRMLCYEARTSEEWRIFAETITNNETYFFRERGQLIQLGELALALNAARRGPVRVLSAGCSSGEEAYGIAMVLASRLGMSGDYDVVGADISEAKLEEARAGRYFERSFHAEEPAPPGITLGDAMTRDAAGIQTVRPSLRSRVTFVRANLSDPSASSVLGVFDVVVCRNLLIYADDSAIPRFCASLSRLVRPEGYLFLGSSDSLGGALAPAFRLERLGDRYVCRRSR